MPSVKAIYRYPIKGLSPQAMTRVTLEPGAPFPFDRVFALARPGAPIDPAEPKWAKKSLFLMLMLDDGLAELKTHLDPATRRLTVMQGNAQLLDADLDDDGQWPAVEAFFRARVAALRETPRLVRSRDGHFMDKPENLVSLINLATVRSLEAQWGYEIDPLRYRANLYIDGAEPWEEFGWIGADIRIGETVMTVDRRNGRCGATNVNPVTGRRDLDIPGSLRAAFGHKDLGVYLTTRAGGEIEIGDPVETPQVEASIRPRPVAARLPTPSPRRFICRGCYFIYEEAQGLPRQDVAPGTPFADIPTSWRCPDCGTDKGNFRPYVAAPGLRGAAS